MTTPTVPVRGWTRDALRSDVEHICQAWPHVLLDVEAIGFPRAVGADRERGHGDAEFTTTEAAGVALAENPSGVAARAVAWLAELGDVVIDLCRRDHAPDGRPWDHDNALGPMRQAVDELVAELEGERKRRYRDGPLGLAQRINRLANKGAEWWAAPAKPKAAPVGVREGQEVCGLCELPITPGRTEEWERPCPTHDGPTCRHCRGSGTIHGGGQARLRRIGDQSFHATAEDGDDFGACYWVVLRNRRLGRPA